MDIKPILKSVPNQNYSSGMKYHLLNNRLEGIHPGVYCRDYSTLQLWVELTGGKCSNYIAEGKKGLPLSNKKFKMGIEYYDGSDKRPFDEKSVQQISTVIHYIEDKLGIDKTEIKLRNEKYFLLLQISEKWIARLYLFSFYTLLLRYALKYKGGDIEEFLLNPTASCNDTEYLKKANYVVKNILAGKETEDKFEDYTNENSILFNSGITNIPKSRVWIESSS